MAKAWLLDMLALNGQCNRVEIVLGPKGFPDAVRLKAPLESEKREVIDTGLYAEDFLSRFGTGKGWQPEDDQTL